MPHVYILRCADGSYYTGSTHNLERRLAEHDTGQGAHYTARRLPIALVFAEPYDRVEDAFRREKQIQGWSRAKKDALIAEHAAALPPLATCQNETHFSARTANETDAPAESLA